MTFRTWAFCLICVIAAAICASASMAAPKHLLVVTVTKGFHHDVIPTAEQVLSDLADRSHDFTVDFARTDADLAQKMSPEGLKSYDGVIFANTTGDLPIPDPQGFLDWVRKGHAFIGMHSASDTFHHFTPYLQMLGAEFKQHGAQVGITCFVDDIHFPATDFMGPTLTITQEEVYQFKNIEYDQIHLLLYLDKHPNDKTPGLYPIAWNRSYGKGRVFYTALGHRSDIWTSPWYQKHILGGIRWALKLAKGDDKPGKSPVMSHESPW